jgi:hypothetical protein
MIIIIFITIILKYLLYNNLALREQAREALAEQTEASGTMDSHLHAVSDASSCHSSSETKMNPRKRVKSRSIARRDESLL